MVTTPSSVSIDSTGCAFDSEIKPTLAHRVCPTTFALTPLPERTLANKSSETIDSLSEFVLSPKSPISEAVLYTNNKEPFDDFRTEPERNNKSFNRSSGISTSSKSWSQTRICNPAESRPRTSNRSKPERACCKDNKAEKP